MPTIDDIKQTDVKHTFQLYPVAIQKKLLLIRQLILEVAEENDEVDKLEETLKWGEPSYLNKNGSTIRIAWKKSTPNEFGIYFNCKTRLIETFKEIYRDTFTYEGKRAITFKLDQEIPTEQLKHCILLSLNYHKLKNLPLLGA